MTKTMTTTDKQTDFFKAVKATPFWVWQISIALVIYAVISVLILHAEGSPGVAMHIDIRPLVESGAAIQVHVAGAIMSFLIGVWLLASPKGLTPHRVFGYTWVVTMAATAISSFFIREIGGGNFSFIHAISAWTLLGLPFALAAARRRDIKSHRSQMMNMFVGAMLIAGLFTFLPGRMMWHTFFFTV